MRPRHTLAIVVTLILLPSPLLRAQSVDPSGHWEGAIQAPDMLVNVEIDLAKDGKEQLTGTFTQPDDRVKGFPLSSVTVEGRSVRFVLRAGSGGGTFTGTLSADGKTMDGDFVTNEGGFTLPFTLNRTGEARIAAAPKSAPIGKEIEGVWTGALDLGAREMRVVVTMANQPDGTATGTIVSPDESGVAMPIAMTQEGTSLTIEVASVGGSFVGTLNAAGTEIAGTWKQGPSSLPLTLRR
jgi:hypothetical protein